MSENSGKLKQLTVIKIISRHFQANVFLTMQLLGLLGRDSGHYYWYSLPWLGDGLIIACDDYDFTEMAPTKRAYDILKNKRTIDLMSSKLENGNIGFIQTKAKYSYSCFRLFHGKPIVDNGEQERCHAGMGLY